jgi:hypothetical protein
MLGSGSARVVPSLLAGALGLCGCRADSESDFPLIPGFSWRFARGVGLVKSIYRETRESPALGMAELSQELLAFQRP